MLFCPTRLWSCQHAKTGPAVLLLSSNNTTAPQTFTATHPWPGANTQHITRRIHKKALGPTPPLQACHSLCLSVCLSTVQRGCTYGMGPSLKQENPPRKLSAATALLQHPDIFSRHPAAPTRHRHHPPALSLPTCPHQHSPSLFRGLALHKVPKHHLCWRHQHWSHYSGTQQRAALGYQTAAGWVIQATQKHTSIHRTAMQPPSLGCMRPVL